jgi:hypothetical protein
MYVCVYKYFYFIINTFILLIFFIFFCVSVYVCLLLTLGQLHEALEDLVGEAGLLIQGILEHPCGGSSADPAFGTVVVGVCAGSQRLSELDGGRGRGCI